MEEKRRDDAAALEAQDVEGPTPDASPLTCPGTSPYYGPRGPASVRPAGAAGARAVAASSGGGGTPCTLAAPCGSVRSLM